MRWMQTSLEVQTDEKGNPSKLDGWGRGGRVRRILDAWRYGGRWWVGEPPRDYFLLKLKDGRVVEICQAAERWTLSRVAD